jgi:hypothetical protein
MEKTQEVKMDFGTLSWSASAIEKVHNCEDCPIRKLAMKQPHSFFARIHAWHTTWWPGWKAHQARQCSYRAMAKIQA